MKERLPLKLKEKLILPMLKMVLQLKSLKYPRDITHILQHLNLQSTLPNQVATMP